jgi:hypothetical protein
LLGSLSSGLSIKGHIELDHSKNKPLVDVKPIEPEIEKQEPAPVASKRVSILAAFENQGDNQSIAPPLSEVGTETSFSGRNDHGLDNDPDDAEPSVFDPSVIHYYHIY